MHSCSTAQSCPTLCHAMDYSPPGSSVQAILQTRILEWVTVSFSRESSWPRAQTLTSCTGRQILYHWATWEAEPGTWLSGNVWREDSSVLSLMSPLSLFKRNSTLLPGTEVTVWSRQGSPLVSILFRTKLLSLIPLSWDMDCVLTLWLTLPLVPLVTVAVRLVFWFLSFPKEVSCTAAYIYS